jgi:hypothetical protein
MYMLSEIFMLVLMFDIIGPMIDPSSPIRDPVNPYNNMEVDHNELKQPKHSPESQRNSTCGELEFICSLFR